MAKVLIFFALFSCLRAEMIEIERMEQILPYVDKTTWVFFDLDNMLIESELQVQQSAGAVFGLTARHPPISVATLRQLAYIGIDLTYSTPFCPHLEAITPTHWEGGVLFISDFNRKGDIFRKWLELSPIRPSKIVFIDINMEKEMEELGIPSTHFHYMK